MGEVLLPPWIIPEKEKHEWLDEGSSVFPSAFSPGLTQRQSYGGLRLRLSRQHTVRLEEKAQLLAVLKATRGRYNAMRSRVHFAQRGSHSTSELTSNNTFVSGTTGWSSQSQYTLSAADRMLRAQRNAVTSNNYALMTSAAVTGLTQYASYAMRFMVQEGKGSYPTGFRIDDSGTTTGSVSAGFGLKTQFIVPRATSVTPAIADLDSSPLIAGDYLLFPYASLSRAPLVDNAPNALLWSQELDNASWTKSGVTIAANTASPSNDSTGDHIREDSALSSHSVGQNGSRGSVSEDLIVYGFFNRAVGTRDVRLAIGSDSSNFAVCTFDLGAGTAGATSVNGTPTDARAFIVPYGNGWYYCAVIAFCAASTTIFSQFNLVSAGSTTYTGDGSSRISAWRLGAARSSLPTRGALTTSTALSTGSTQQGSGIYLKGLPASTNGLLLAGDWFEISGELKQATCQLNSDASGMGFLQFEPSIVRSPSDNDPVIVVNPMGKFLVSSINIDNEFGTQARVSYDLEHIYE